MKCTEENEKSESPMMTAMGSEQLYLYSLKKMAEQNARNNKITLTNLYGKNAFLFLANENIYNHPENRYALIRMDIYRFKTVNEFCGRDAGDKLLVFIADCFRKYENNETIVGHLRADVFVMCVPYQNQEQIIQIVNDINDKIAGYQIACKILPAFGICVSKQGMDVSLLSDYANLALQQIKGKVFSWYCFYNEKMRQQLLFEKKIENEIVEALNQEHLKVYIQPKVDMRTEKVIGGEALIRWERPQEGFFYPDQFIPVLEKSGYIIDVDIYAWRHVFEALREWIDKGLEPVQISINVSRMHAYQKDFQVVLCDMASKYHISPDLIKLEVTESVLSENQEEFYSNMYNLQKKGFEFSMDDFGSGYSSMNMLKDEPIDEVKLDRNFLSDSSQAKGQIIIRHMIDMVRELDLDMIAEGVETREQAEFLMKCGCFRAQGYYYYRPMPCEEFQKLLVVRRRENT